MAGRSQPLVFPVALLAGVAREECNVEPPRQVRRLRKDKTWSTEDAVAAKGISVAQAFALKDPRRFVRPIRIPARIRAAMMLGVPVDI